MIRIDPNYRVLAALVPEHEQRYVAVDRATRKAVHAAADAAVADVSLNCRESLGAASFVTERGDILERHHLYALVPVGSEIAAAREMVQWIEDKHGAGDVWHVGPLVDLLADDGKVPCGVVGDEQCVMMRSIYFHDPVMSYGYTSCGACSGSGCDRCMPRVHGASEEA